MTYDGNITYLYDAEGRIASGSSSAGKMGYIYDAEGRRVGKGLTTSVGNDPTMKRSIAE